MGASAVIMGAGGAITQTVSAYSQSRATKASAELQASVNRTNAIISDNQANDAISRGNESIMRERLKTSQLKSRQRAVMAKNGVVLDEGTSASILHDTDLLGTFDEGVIAQNAQREAFGYRTQSNNYRSDARILKAKGDSENPWASGAATLLTSGSQVAENWYRYKKTADG